MFRSFLKDLLWVFNMVEHPAMPVCNTWHEARNVCEIYLAAIHNGHTQDQAIAEANNWLDTYRSSPCSKPPSSSVSSSSPVLH